MLSLKPFSDRRAGFSDLLPYAALIDDGIVLTKGGSLLGAFFYGGPDVASMTDQEQNYLTHRLNAALAGSGRGSGWSYWIDAVRMASVGYPAPERSHFPDPISRLIDEERRQLFQREGAHFETEHAFIVQYQPPRLRQTKATDWFYDDDYVGEPTKPADRHLAYFKQTLSEIEDALSDSVRLRRMGALHLQDTSGRPIWQDELVNYLHFCVTGQLSGVNIPSCPMYLDALIGGQEFWTGDTPKIGDQFITCIGIEGFPSTSWPFMSDMIDSVPIAHRFSSRFIALDQHVAISELHKFRRHWQQWKYGFIAQMSRNPRGYVNQDAATMEREAEGAISDAHGATNTYGYYTPVVVLMGPTRHELAEGARALTREIARAGFPCRIETVNAVEAWLGTLPGQRHANVRRPLISSVNLADLAPCSTKFPGAVFNPSALFPPEAPPLMHAATSGATPFRLHLHVDDVGHTLVLGPTGAGKSTLLCMIAAQFLRYADARVTIFDKGRSALALALAVGGTHYELSADDETTGLAPLAFIDSDAELAWASDWIATCYELQTKHAPSPEQAQKIRHALGLMRQSAEGRTISDFCTTVQDQAIQQAMEYYRIGSPLGPLLDAHSDGVKASHLTVFELDDVLTLGPEGGLPVLLTLFRRFERSLTGKPALLILDEAWVMLAHKVFAAKIREWLKTLRKANVAVVLATQSLSDAVNSGQLDVLLESCPTRILLPNEEATRSGTDQVMGPRDLYATFGLNAREIENLAQAAKKREYYVSSPIGKRMIDLGLGPVALAFTGVSSREDVARVKELHRQHGVEWPSIWLQEKGIKTHAL